MIVTGSSRGIDATIARRPAQNGLAVPANDAGNVAGEDRTVADSAAADSGADTADIRKPDGCVQSSGTAAAEFGVDVSLNNVGSKMLSSIAATDDAVFDRQIAVNLKEFFDGLLLAVRRLRDGGTTVTFSSSVVGHGLHGSAIIHMAGPHPGPGEFPIQTLPEAEVSWSWAELAVHCRGVAEARASLAGGLTPTCSSLDARRSAPASAASATPGEEGAIPAGFAPARQAADGLRRGSPDPATSATRHGLSQAAQPEGGE